MIFGIIFASWRFIEIVTLIPIMGMLSYFVHLHVSANLLTPTYILLLFIVSVLALAWALFTVFSYRNNTRFIGLIDLAFFGALIAGVYQLRFVTNTDCVAVVAGGSSVTVDLGAFGGGTINSARIGVDKTCAMLKACFALAIMNCVFFFVTGLMCLMHKGEEKKVVHRRRGSSHGRRSHSGSRRSRRSSHSHSRTYV
ncbi:hypothetical protein QBC39DRAFT_259084 [Podospora conica]|nr:hypothetical protein QBC39DRAFT_259084 [Schizothecium conicum]